MIASRIESEGYHRPVPVIDPSPARGRRLDLRLWLIDPISYSGMAYSDVGQICALASLGQESILMGSDGWMLGEGLIRRIAVFRGTSGNRPRWRKGLAYVRSVVRLVWNAAQSRPNVVHWQYTELPIADYVAMLAMRRLGIKQVYTAHELLPWQSRSYHRAVFAAIYRAVDAVVVHNPEQLDAIVSTFSVPAANVTIAPLGDYASFADPGLAQVDARRELGLALDRPVALFFGAIRPGKGLADLIRAWPAVVAEVPDALLVVAGKPFKGVDTGDLVRLIRDLGIGNSITTRFEQVDPDEANAYYRAADVVVLPYHEIGTSGVLRYAFNSARAVVATAVGEHGRHVRTGVTGYLVEAGDGPSLAAAIGHSLGDRVEIQAMGARAKAYADAYLGWRDPARTLLALYDRISAAARERPDPSSTITPS
jgi:D-inositol-3-phosphate glycosyltransferase